MSHYAESVLLKLSTVCMLVCSTAILFYGLYKLAALIPA